MIVFIMTDNLIHTSRVGDMDVMNELIWEDDDVLGQIDEKMFIDSPLHITACSWKTRFEMEIKLMHSFVKKLNKFGLNSMHLVLIKGYFELMFLFLHAGSDFEVGLTPLHYAIKHINIHVMVKFLVVCPKSIKDMTVDGRLFCTLLFK
ncbi:hypothetical protein QQP08_014938 [Theobroma cacao]|nr:hypothetical protein QQP08_012922 [Theobroma cacao]WRX22451.1 hypothetical protein QQP08_014938 [Theobroma cacao]